MRKPLSTQLVLSVFREPETEPRSVQIQRLAYEKLSPVEFLSTHDILEYLPIFRVLPYVAQAELFRELDRMAAAGLAVKRRGDHGFVLWRRATVEGGGD